MKRSLAALLPLVLLVGAGQGQPASDPDPFLAALRKREAAVKVVDITFSMQETLFKSKPVPVAEPPARGRVESSVEKLVLEPTSEKVVLESTNRLVIQGAMTRFEGAHPTWNPLYNKPMPRHDISVVSTRFAKSFRRSGFGADVPHGSIAQPSRNSRLSAYSALPVVLAYRGLDIDFTSPDIRSFEPSPVRQRIGGGECIEYASQAGKDVRVSLFVDPRRDYNVVRRLITRQGKVEMQTDIAYARNPVCEWVPESWVRQVFSGSGKVKQQTEVRVVSSKFNEPLPEDQFDIVFPAGTRVYRGDEKNYYRVEADGSFRLVPPTGVEPPPEVSPPVAPWYGRSPWWIVGGMGTVILAAVLIRRRFARMESAVRRRGESPPE